MTSRVIEAEFEGVPRGFSRVISREPYAEVLPYQAGDSAPLVRNSADPTLVRKTEDYQGKGLARFIVTTYTQNGQDVPDHQALLEEALGALPSERERLCVGEDTRVSAIRVSLAVKN